MSYLTESENSNVVYRNGQQGSDTSSNIMKSIDLFTGTVKFPLSLCYLEGRDGLSITVQANYIQNNPNNYHKENRKLNNSILGYGWNMGLPAIVSKNRLVKQGYQRDFYLSEGGKYPLYRTGREGGHVQFFSVEQPNWKFYFYDQEEETYWEIIKEDGSKYKYGGSKDSNELTVCWDNWVGPSTMNGAENFTTSWHLSMVESSKGSKIIYEYDNIMENLADSNYTRTIRLKKIISSYQQEIVFCYEDKSKEEYGINHGSYDKENPYQEKYEDKFLDKIQIFNYNKKLLYTQKLSYDLKQSENNELKRFLTDIAQINSDGKVMPPLSLNYSENEELFGILDKVNYPLSSEIEYDYKKFQLPKSDGYQSFYIDQDWDYKVYSGNDFNFMILNRDNYIKLKIYYWDMGWHEYEDNSINEIPVEDIKVNLGVGYVCITYKNLLDNNYKLKIIKRSPVKKFQWDSEDFTIENTDSKPTIACGSDFIAIQCKMENTLKILQYKYTDNKWHENKLSVESRDFNGLGAGDGFLFGAYGDNNSNNVRIMSFYSDEDHNWQFGDFIDISVDVDWNLILKDYIWSISYSQAGTCFITHNNNEIKTTLILLSWTDKFKFTKHETHNFSYDDNIKNQYFYTVATDTMIGYGENVYRYSPNGWKYHKILNPREGGEYRYSYGSDIALAVENINGVQKFYSISFDPYTQQWSDRDIPKSEDLYNIEGTCQPLIVDEYAVLGRTIFTRNKENIWDNIGFLEEQTDYSNIQIDSEGKYLLYQLQGINRVYQVPFENNRISEKIKICDSEIINNKKTAGYQACRNTFYTFSGESSPNAVNFYYLDENIYKDKQDTILINHVKCNDGFKNKDIYIDYDLNTSRLEAGKAAMKNTFVSPIKEDGSFGKTEYVYFNGANTDDFDYPDDEYTNVKDYYTHMTGQLYFSKEYDEKNRVVKSSKNWLKAMDTLGFMICQTKICESKYHGLYDDKFEEKDNSYALTKTSIIEYEDKFNLKRKVIKSGLNGDGEEIKISTEIRYLWEDNEQLLNKNALSDISMTIKKEEISGKILEVNKYEYDFDSNNVYYKNKELMWDGTGDYKKDESNWICKNEITKINPNYDKVSEKDMEGISTTYIYDRDNKFITAKFDNAQEKEVFYCGFEPYENTQEIKMKKGNVNDYITDNERFSGTKSLLIEKNNSMSITMTRTKNSSRLSFAVKTNREFYVSWGDENEENKLSYPSTEGNWQRIDQILSNSESKKGIFTVSFYGIDDIYLDALFISPLLSQGESYVYGTDFMIQIASHKNYGRGIKMFYDKYKNPVATAGDDGIFIGYSRKCYGKYNQDCELDETLSIEMPKGGYLQWYENGFKNTNLWTLNDNEWTFEKNRNFILFFAKNSGNQNIICEKLKIEILCTQLIITYDGKIVLKNEKNDGNHYLFIKIGNRIQFSCEDKILYSEIHEFSEESKCTLEIEKNSDIICIGYCKDPKISLSYSDYSGNVHQDMGITENGLIVGQTIFNELGQAEITTKKAYFEMEIWKYRSNFVISYNWDTGILEGEIADKYPEDNGFSYSQIKSSLAPTPEPREVGQAGKNHAIKGLGNIINLNEYVNEKEFYGLDEKSYMLKVQKTPDNIINIDAIDSFDNKIMSLCKNSYDEENIKIIKYKYDYNGKLTNVYYPNYFTNVSEKEKYESQYQYDRLGRITMQKEPDGGIVRFIYDKTGKIRFKKNGEDSNYYIYYVYDNYTRKIEEGRVEENWNEDQLKKEALIVGNAPKNSIPKIKYHYDGDEKNIYDIRKLHLIENFNNDGILESYEKYDYDYEGRIIKKNIVFGNHEDIVIMKYDNQGNVIQYSFGDESEDAINYIYDIQSRMVGVSYKGDEIYSCSYLPEGNVAEEKFMPKSSNELCRTYSYNSSMWLKKLEDEYFVQELEYDETSSKSNSGGRITKCKSTFLKNIPKNIKTEITYKYSYDSYGRLMEYNKDGMIYEIKFDANGNQIGDNSEENEFSYESGTNKLTTYKEKSFSYDNVGNINSIASTKDEKLFLDYDKVLNKVSNISNEYRKNLYSYGTQGNIAYTSNDETTYVNYDEKDRLLTETRNGKKVICLYGANGMMGQIKDGKVYYFIKDYQSSVREIYDGENILAVFNYNTFGKLEDNIINDSIVNELIPIRFTSARYEEEIGLYRMKYRLYDPVTGRFINIDPENQHTSSYIYGYADWVNYFDPDGAISLGSILSIAVGVVIIGVGAAIAIGTAGMGTGAGFALGLLGAGLIGAGIGFTTYGITSAINNDFNIGDCLIYGGVGFVSGVVGAGIGAGITAITPVIGATASGLVDIGAGIVVGGTDALISNGFININHSRDFFYNWEQTVTIGCIVGGLTAGFSGMCSSLRNNRAFIGRNADNTIGVENFDMGRFGHLHTTYRSYGAGERYADFTRVPRGVLVSDHPYVPNQFHGRGMGNNAMEVNTSSMRRFLRNGNRINNEYRNVPRFRETNLFGPNCTTYTIDRFAGAGINMPIWLRTPTLVNKWAAWICRFQ